MFGFQYLAEKKRSMATIYGQDVTLSIHRTICAPPLPTSFHGIPDSINLTVPSVRTVDRLVRAVSRQLMIDSLDIAKLISDSAYCAQMGYTQETLPSLFIPNTYEVYWNMSADAFMKRMQKNMLPFGIMTG